MVQFLGEVVIHGAGPEKRTYLRPPGALEEAAFLLTCTRCGDCVSACPRGALRLLPLSAGVAAGTPFIDPAERACDLCGGCLPACRAGALQSAADDVPLRIGLAEVDSALCWAHRGQICDLCYQRCPLPDRALRMVAGKPQVIQEGCTGCGLCVEACAAAPPAVRILPCS